MLFEMLPAIRQLTADAAGVGFFLCTQKEARPGRNGEFLSLTLQDATGRIAARVFFPKVVQASSGARLTVQDVLASVEGNARAVAYFRYDWWLKDGSLVSFECADVFDFDAETGAIRSLVILYDTHPLREPVGSQFA